MFASVTILETTLNGNKEVQTSNLTTIQLSQVFAMTTRWHSLFEIDLTCTLMRHGFIAGFDRAAPSPHFSPFFRHFAKIDGGLIKVARPEILSHPAIKSNQAIIFKPSGQGHRNRSQDRSNQTHMDVYHNIRTALIVVSTNRFFLAFPRIKWTRKRHDMPCRRNYALRNIVAWLKNNNKPTTQNTRESTALWLSRNISVAIFKLFLLRFKSKQALRFEGTTGRAAKFENNAFDVDVRLRFIELSFSFLWNQNNGKTLMI